MLALVIKRSLSVLWVSAETNKKEDDDFTILLVGKRGCGKSTLANLIFHGERLCDKNGDQHFKVADGPGAVTLGGKRATSSDGITVIDTMGLFEAEKDPKQALLAFRDSIKLAGGGVNVVAICSDHPATKADVNSFNYLAKLLGEDECRRRLFFVRTKANESARKSDEEQLKTMQHYVKTDAYTRNVVEACGGLNNKRWILTEVPTLAAWWREFFFRRRHRRVVRKRLIANFKEFKAGKYLPPAIVESYRKHAALTQACAEFTAKTADTEKRRILKDISEKCEAAYSKSIEDAVLLNLDSLFEEKPKLVKVITQLQSKSGDGIAIAGLVGGSNGALAGPAGAAFGAAIGSIAGYYLGRHEAAKKGHRHIRELARWDRTHSEWLESLAKRANEIEETIQW